jgi:hypothetical protein
MAIKRPLKSDFDVVCHESFVEVTFKPTKSYYVFNRLVDKKDIARHGPLSPDAHVRHAGLTGDTGEYPAWDVLFMARHLATEVARGGGP